jgi:hypothetical protein
MGWKFAAMSGQDTKRWQRGTVSGERLPVEAIPQGSLRPEGVTRKGGGSANAGFLSRPILPAGFIPTAITSGDFNEDGALDFAISNGGDNTIYVFLGNGDGTFKVPEILYTQGQSPDWITAIELRKNGHLDLAVTDGDSNTVEVFLGNGDGTFQPSTQTSVPQIPTFILAADVNNDGNQDLVVGLVLDLDQIEPQFEVLLGNGSGGFSGTLFSAPVNLSLEEPVPTNWIAAGDLNNDGYIDFVTTVTDGLFIPYLNQAGAGFSVVDYLGYDEGDNVPLVVGLGDMDEDGCLDAVELGALGILSIAKGTCDGEFPRDPDPTAMVGDLDPAIQIADVDGDGHLDVVGSAVFYPLADDPAAGTEAGYLVSVLKGDGKGDLAVAQTYRGGADAYSLVVADFNGDHRPEILTADSLENHVSLFTNDGSGNYGPPLGETIGYTIGPVNAPDNQSPLEVADLNGDGNADLLLVEYGVDLGNPELTTLLNDGTGKFLPPVRTPITDGVSFPVPTFVVGAFRNPAKRDVIYINTYNITNGPFSVDFFAGKGDGTFNSQVTLTTLPNPQRVVAGDFNNDGKLDFAVVGGDSTGQNWEFNIFLGHGDGTFTQLAAQEFPILSSLSPQQFFAIDLNHDGKLDLLVGLNSNLGWVAGGDDLIELLGNGDGTFQAPTILIPHFGPVAIADVNSDGYPDLIQDRDPNTDIAASLLSQPGATVYLGSADGTFHQQPSYDLPGVADPSFNPALVGDFNGDGIPDIAVRCWNTTPTLLVEPRLVILQGVGDGTFIVTGHAYQLPGPSAPIVGADFNNDGMTDLVELTGLTSSFTTIPASPAPALDISLDSSPLLGNTGMATITLDLPATSGEDVSLSASDPAIQLPASAHFNAGQQSQDVSFTLGSGFDATHIFALYAQLGSQTAVAYSTKPNPNLTIGVSAVVGGSFTTSPNEITVEPGESFSLTYNLTSQGGYSGTFSSFQCKGLPPGATCSFANDSMIVLPGGNAQLVFQVQTSTSTPFGKRTIQIESTDGFFVTSGTFELGIGDFALSVSPATVITGPSGTGDPTVTATTTYGLKEDINLACTGLPANATCSQDVPFGGNGGATGLSVHSTQLAANDYPFQITGTADIVSHTISAVLRVGDFTATLDKTTATLSGGQSATFNVTLTSINHYATNITLYCQPLQSTVTCSVAPTVTTLNDDGTATVQLTLTASGSASRPMRRATKGSLGGSYILVCLFPISLLVIRRNTNLLLVVVATTILAGMVSCGGGASGTGGGSPPPPPPQTVTVNVIAQADTTAADINNQKLPGPIVVTLQ